MNARSRMRLIEGLVVSSIIVGLVSFAQWRVVYTGIDSTLRGFPIPYYDNITEWMTGNRASIGWVAFAIDVIIISTPLIVALEWTRVRSIRHSVRN